MEEELISRTGITGSLPDDGSTEQMRRDRRAEEQQQGQSFNDNIPPDLIIDEKRLADYLQEHISDFEAPISIKQFSGGQSNPTYLITCPNRRYVLRRKPPGQLLKSAHAVDREYRVLSSLFNTDVPVPKTYCLCTDESIIGTWFYVMEFLDGRIVWDPLSPEYTKIERHQFYMAMNRTLAKLHQVNVHQCGLTDYGRPENYVARQISRWTKQYRLNYQEHAADKMKISAIDRLVDWLPENLPKDKEQTSIVHGDFRIDNLVFAANTPDVIGILDWELSTLGHPVADFSYHCMQWRLPQGLWGGMVGLDLTEFGIPEEKEYVELYCEATGRESLPNWDFYMVYNLFRMAAIFHGIAGRVETGNATSAKAREMGALARPLAEAAWQQVEAHF